MHQLPIFLNLTGRTVVLVGEGEAAEAKARLIQRAGGRIISAWEAGATIAFVALGDEAAARAAADALRAHGLLVNVVDRPDLCDFTTPAIVDRAPVTIAIGTGGASAGLAKAIRQRLEALLPARLGDLAGALYAARAAMKARWPVAADRRRAIDAALAPGGALDPLDAGAADRVGEWLAAAAPDRPSRLETIRLTSADPDELTLRAARLLGEADHVFHPPHIPAAILARTRADAARHIAAAPPRESPPGLSLWLEMQVIAL
ncbi:precorrin-2 dehydrogenase/sirohydrochlorin ferrochelatase family protein [Sphingopyxis alaskensis]|jgi:uroporphyrin-III C-methyltransferase/precorrin-2 dehydrogenase/sirohydrochlorin ferrochelatase|uniref:precorrin-2 dehydrogenase n=1 Tax=Sphingopyxis alaskensis (strain DSM 13593 / LMG 18877 / RB2256) TaxID=317655 RepID=Q1GWP4_SPHAL|nr:bifunctional precorrin-2 dehydrogenase/sirohydrochlorin ferrochelatase [Sphingopyxis alaskensis]ABF51928.1 siroheme synthase-like protein [Sphingopyxis alaskensis RB2256]MCM3420321.1 siroheme synthase [Sphingopyxis alaskensis]